MNERLEDIRHLTKQLLGARDPTNEVKRLSARLRQELAELEAAEAIVSKPPISDK